MTSTAAALWDAALAWFAERPAFERRVVLRSLYLRSLEAARGRPARPREAAGTLRRLLHAAWSRSPVETGTTALWLVAEAPTPSNLGTVLATAQAAREANLEVVVLAGDERVMRAAAPAQPGRQVLGLDGVAARLGALRRTAAAARAVLAAGRDLRAFTPRPPFFARLQLQFEAGLAAIARDAVLGLPPGSRPRVFVAPSEYFAVGAGVSAAAKQLGVSWITVQHGVVNRTYLPSVADEYWVWGDESVRALTSLASAQAAVGAAAGQVPPTRVVGAIRMEALRGRAVDAAAGRSGQSGRRNLVLFSQSHGLEYEQEAHEALAAQLARLLERTPSAYLVIKPHPSEDRSIYEAKLGGHPRVNVADRGAGVADLCANASCCIALDSTALLEAAVAGVLAVQALPGPGSMVVQRVATHALPMDSLAAFLEQVVADERAMERALAQQRDGLPSLLAYLGRAGRRHGESLRQAVGSEPDAHRAVPAGNTL